MSGYMTKQSVGRLFKDGESYDARSDLIGSQVTVFACVRSEPRIK